MNESTNFHLLKVFSVLILFFNVGHSSDFMSVKEHVDYINSKNRSWSAQENPNVEAIEGSPFFSDVNIDSSSDLPVLHYRNLDVTSFPENFDARNKWPKCRELMNRIRDTGKCVNASWAAATASTITDRVCIGSVEPKFFASTEDFLTCCKKCLLRRHSCGGGDVGKAFNFWKTEGVVTGEEFDAREMKCKPFSYAHFKKGENVPCTKRCTNPRYDVSYESDKIKASLVYQLPFSMVDMQREIFNNGPIVAAFKLYEDLFHYKLGVYHYVRGKYKGYLYIKIIGWGVEEKNLYWLAANSWGKEWGLLHGHFKFLRGVKTDFVYGYKPWTGRITGLTRSEYFVGAGESDLRRNNSYSIQCFLLIIVVFVVNKLQI